MALFQKISDPEFWSKYILIEWLQRRENPDHSTLRGGIFWTVKNACACKVYFIALIIMVFQRVVMGFEISQKLKVLCILFFQKLFKIHWRIIYFAVVILFLDQVVSKAQTSIPLGIDPYLTFSGNFDVGYQKTQFYAPHQNAIFGDWDSRIELWLPPFRTNFSWGPYLRVAGVASSKDTTSSWFDNVWLAEPGGGLQLYPFSHPYFKDTASAIGDILGPMRLFAEYNQVDYWGSVNTWRATKQIRTGMDFWRARHVNDTDYTFWNEVWTGLFWQSANDFSKNYDAVVFANSVRIGARVPGQGFFSTLSPYGALESSLTGHPSYYWENRLLLGGGLRIAPPFQNIPQSIRWLNRTVFFVEYLNVATYYREPHATSVPRYDVHAGLSFSIGEWYR